MSLTSQSNNFGYCCICFEDIYWLWNYFLKESGVAKSGYIIMVERAYKFWRDIYESHKGLKKRESSTREKKKKREKKKEGIFMQQIQREKSATLSYSLDIVASTSKSKYRGLCNMCLGPDRRFLIYSKFSGLARVDHCIMMVSHPQPQALLDKSQQFKFQAMG